MWRKNFWLTSYLLARTPSADKTDIKDCHEETKHGFNNG